MPARNRRLGDALQQRAFCSLRGSPGATAYYQQFRARHIGRDTKPRCANSPTASSASSTMPEDPHHYDEQTAWAHIHNAAADSVETWDVCR